MNEERLLTVLLAPHVSEKSAVIGDKNNQVIFKVVRDATKNEVQKAVEKHFNVKVRAVNILNQKGKAKRFGQQQGRRKSFKKAYVSLEAGQEIDFAAVEA